MTHRPERAVRRPAAARGHRARARQQPVDPAGRRADRQPRLEDRRRDHGALRAAAQGGQHHRPRHARARRRRLRRSRRSTSATDRSRTTSGAPPDRRAAPRPSTTISAWRRTPGARSPGSSRSSTASAPRWPPSATPPAPRPHPDQGARNHRQRRRLALRRRAGGAAEAPPGARRADAGDQEPERRLRFTIAQNDSVTWPFSESVLEITDAIDCRVRGADRRDGEPRRRVPPAAGRALHLQPQLRRDDRLPHAVGAGRARCARRRGTSSACCS